MSVAIAGRFRPVPAGLEASAHGLLKAGIVFAVLALTLLDRFGLRLTSDWALPASVLGMYVLAAAMLLTGRAELDRSGAFGLAAVVGATGLSFLVNTWLEPRPYQSVTAWMLIPLSYAPFALGLVPHPQAAPLWRWTLRFFVGCIVAVALAGIAQFFTQFAFNPPWLFNYLPLLPEAIRASGDWNTAHPVATWVQSDGYWIKSNGFFLREASMFSLLLGIGIVCELVLDARRWVLALLGAGMVLSYSGSGLLCLAFALAFPLNRGTVLRTLAVAACAAVLLVALGDVLNLSYTLNRLAEFGTEGSSAYCRFVHPAVAVAQGMYMDPWAALLGHGPGSMPRMGATCVLLHQPTYGKLLFEYGLLGALAFGALIVHALTRSGAPLRLRIALGASWIFIGGNLVSSEVIVMLYLLCAAWPPRAAAPKAA